MMTNTEGTKSTLFSWSTAGRIGFTALFVFWFYMTWNSTANLDIKLNAAKDLNAAIYNLQIEFKDEIQEWEMLLLRSADQDTLNKNWINYDAQYRKVIFVAQDIIQHSETPAVTDQIKVFIEAHAANRELYKNSALLLIKSKFDPRPADAMVKGVEGPLFDHLQAAATGMLDDRKRINEGLVDEARNNVEQDLIALAFLALLAVWMPKY